MEGAGIRILLSPRRQDAKRQAQGLSFRANARDLGKISLFVRNDNALPLRLCVPSTLLRTCFARDNPISSFASFALLSVIICAACANFPGAKNARIRTFLPPRRKDAKFGKKDSLSFRPKGEIFLRSLAFARDDGPRPVTFAPWRLCGR